MGLLIGPTPWWQSTIFSSCPVGTTLPDGSKLICKAGGTAWIVAPASTQVSSVWVNGGGTGLVGNKPLLCSWPCLNTRMINCGFNPSDWFVPSCAQLQNPGYVCRTQWDPCSTYYWSSTENNTSDAYLVSFTTGAVCAGFNWKEQSICLCVRAFRCVTY